MKHKRLQGFIFLIIGIILISFYFFRIYQPKILSFGTLPSYKGKAPINVYEKPVSIKINSQNISLPIEESEIVKGVWTTSDDKASHLGSSANPGENGNIIIYAHNKIGLFANLTYIRKGDQVVITTTDDRNWSYEVVETAIVSPSDIQYVQPKSNETLTLYTCTGFADSKRFMVISKPKY